MSVQVQHIRFRVRGRTAAQWAASNEVLLERELGLETDTRKFKFGTGATPWNSLPYAGGGGGVQEVLGDGAVEVDASDPDRPVVRLSAAFLAGLLDEAPLDGALYGRKNGGWAQVPEVSSGNLPITDQAHSGLTDQAGLPLVGNAQPVQWARLTEVPVGVQAAADGTPQLSAYTFATRPPPSPPWRLAVLTDIAGGAEPCFSDGTDWRRCSDRTIASI